MLGGDFWREDFIFLFSAVEYIVQIFKLAIMHVLATQCSCLGWDCCQGVMLGNGIRVVS